MKTILLIRHGQTAADRRVFCGSTDVSLSALGKRQSHKIADMLSKNGTQLIITTGLQRTDHCGDLAYKHGILHTIDHRLREIDFGTWEGMTWKDIEKAYSEAANAWLNDPETVCFPKGEDMEHFEHRIRLAWQSVLGRSEQSVAIVAHSGVLSYLLQYLGRQQGPVYLQHGQHVTVRI